MFSLKLLGGASIEGKGGALTGPAAQRHRMALLAMLALSRGKLVSRDKLIAGLWPESETKQARHRLSECIYVLRKTLGDEAILSEGDSLRLNPEAVGSDAGEFRERLERDEHEAAVLLYAGPFLDGLYLGEAPEFERWMEGERDLFSRMYQEALEKLAEVAESRGDLAKAAEWWRRLASEDPFNSRLALRLMQVLNANGDHANALQYGLEHAELLERELGAKLSPEMLDFVTRLREGPGASPAPETTVGGAPLAEPVTTGVPRVEHRWRSLGLAPLGGILVLAVAVAWLLSVRLPAWRGSDGAPEAPTVDRLAVLPFSYQGSEAFAYVSEGMVNLLSATLEGPSELQPLDPRAVMGVVEQEGGGIPDPQRARAIATRLGVRRYIQGEVVESGGRLHISARLYDVSRPGEEPVQAEAEGEVSQFLELVDDLTVDLMLRGSLGPVGRLKRVAAVTTASMVALSAYLEGERLFRSGQYDAAAEAYDRAVRADTAFALAWYRLSIAAEWRAGWSEVVREAAQRAVLYSERLPEHERKLAEGLAAWRRGAGVEAERTFVEISNRWGGVEEGMQLGEVLFHYGPMRGHSIAGSRSTWERVLSFEAEHVPALVHLMRIAAFEERVADLDSLYETLLRVEPDSEWVRRMGALRAFSVGDAAAQDQVVDWARLGSAASLANMRMEVGVFGQNLEGPGILARPSRTDPLRQAIHRAGFHASEASRELARGRWRAAQEELAAAERITTPESFLELRSQLSLSPFLSLPRDDLAALRSALAEWDTAAVAAVVVTSTYNRVHPLVQWYLLGLLAARLGEDSVALSYAAGLDRLVGQSGSGSLAQDYAQTVRAEVAWQRGDASQAIRELEQARFETFYLWYAEPLYSHSYARFLRAEALKSVGRYEEALRWYETASGPAFPDLIHLAPSHFRRAQIYEALGQLETAAEHYARFVELWKDCDPELQPLVAEAEQHLQPARR
jgi:DNA-binding SARP family transcriptional activator/TolB-like protein